jgi:hypothetical protein
VKKTDTDLAPEPLGTVDGFDGHIVLVYECPKCFSVVTSLDAHRVASSDCS